MTTIEFLTTIDLDRRKVGGDLRWHALKRCDLHCERCGAEDGHRVVRYLYSDPIDWVAHVPGHPYRQDFSVVTIALVVVPKLDAHVDNLTVDDLDVLCGGCMLARDVAYLVDRYHVDPPKRRRTRVAA